MIIYIPLNFDETVFEGQIAKEIENKAVEALVKKIEESIKGYSYSYGKDRVKDNLLNMACRHLDDFIDKYKDEIISAAGQELATRLSRTKKAKELLGDLVTDEERSKENE